MKRILSLFVTCLMTATLLTACGGGKSDAPAADTSGGTAAAPVGEAVELRLGHTQSTEHLVNKTAEEFARLVNEQSGGSITISVYPAETLGSNKELADACSAGELDLYISSTAQYTQRYTPFSVVDAFYMFRDTDHLLNFFESDVYEELEAGLAESCNVHILSNIYYGARQMTTRGTPLYGPDDFVGLKMRAANEPLPIAAIETLGGSPTPIPYNETYLALQQGVVDGQENPPMSIQTMKFNEVQDYLNITNHQYQMLSIFLSDATMSRLSDEQIELLYSVAAQVAQDHNVAAIAAEADIIAQLGESMEIIESDTVAFAERIAPMYDQFADEWGADTVARIQAIA